VKPRRKARIDESCRSPGVHQEREWPFAADTDVRNDHSPVTDDPYRHNRRRTGLRRTGFLEHGQLYASDHGRRYTRLRLAAATPGDEGDDGDGNERMSRPQSSPHGVRSLLRPHCPILPNVAGTAASLRALKTERLVLRPIAMTDVDQLVALASNPGVMRYPTGGRPSTSHTTERPQEMSTAWRRRVEGFARHE
jgi:hypothetical protein